MNKLFRLWLTALIILMSASSVHADLPFRNHRYDSWKVLKLPENAIVFAGNSITDMHLWAEAFGNDPRIVNRGNSGGYSSEVLENVESWVRFKPAKVFLMIGTNDLGTNMSEQSIARNIRRTVNVIRRESPLTEIYLESILPAYDQNYKTLSTIQAANKLIKQIADENEQTTYIDLYSKLTGIREGEPYSLDKLHLMANGYRIWTTAIQDYVGIKSTYPTNTPNTQYAAGLGGSHGMRATYFSVLPTQSTDILFFGDEMVKNGEWNELLGNAHVKNRGAWWGYGGNIAAVSKYVDAAFANAAKGITRKKPAKMLLYTGTEDVNGSTDLATVKSNYKALVDKLKSKAEGTPIALVSLMPTETANARITQFNAWLKAQCEADKTLTYIDIYTPLATAEGCASQDLFVGNYLYGKGYIKVARQLVPFIGKDACQVISDDEAASMIHQFNELTKRDQQILAEEQAAGSTTNDAWETDIDWYTMRIGANGLYISNNGEDSFISLNRNTSKYGDSDLWMRVGNNTEGYTLYNKEAGPDKVLAAPIEMLGNTGASSYPILVDKDNIPAGYCSKWVFTKSTDLGSNTEAWYMYEKGYTANKVNNRNGLLAFWSSGADSGSAIQWNWAQKTFSVNMSTGTFTAKNGNGTWAQVWQSKSSKPKLKLDAGHNNMSVANSNGQVIQAFRGTYDPEAYRLSSVESGYTVVSYSFDFVKSGNTAITVKDAFNKSYTSSDKKQTISCHGLEEGEAQFTLSGSNNGIDISNMKVTLQVLPEKELGVRVFDNDASAVPYRIPAVAKNRQGELLFVTDYRYSGADIGMATNGKLDLRIRTLSTDSVWGPVRTLAACITTGKFTAFGDPCIVADRTSDKVMVTSCCGNVSFPGGTHDNHQGWARFISEDGGKTWSKHTDISQQVFDQLDKRSDGPIRCFFIGSGKISQSKTVKVGEYYRVYCAALVKAGDGTNCNYVFYSDDFGENWKLLGTPDDCPIPSGGDEPKADELPDGSILISSRVTGGRYYNVYHFSNSAKGEGKWGDMVFSGSSNNGVTAQGNSCNGEIMIVPVTRLNDGVKTHILLQSVPFGNGRANVGIYYKELTDLTKYRTAEDIAPNWDGRFQVTRKDAAYSTMCLDKDNHLAFFYEEQGYNGGYNMVYRKLSIEEITDGRYTYSSDADYFDGKGVKEVIDRTFGTKNVGPIVGQYQMEAASVVSSAYEAYETAPSRDAYEMLNEAIFNAPRVGIEDPRFYTFRNLGRGSQNYRLYASTSSVLTANTSKVSDAHLWRLYLANEEENLYYIRNKKYPNSYIGQQLAVETRTQLVQGYGENNLYQIISDTQGRSKLKCVTPVNSTYCYAHLAGDCQRIVPWLANSPSDNAASYWYIEPTDELDAIYDVHLDIDDSIFQHTYDLQGRRVGDMPAQGLYIRGRRKWAKNN